MILMIVMLFIVTGIFAIGMHLNILQALYFFISLLTTVYIFKVVLEYNYLDANKKFNYVLMVLGWLSLIMALIVFGTNEVEDGWLIYIIYLVMIGSAFHILGF
jgi:hypothetical protein